MTLNRLQRTALGLVCEAMDQLDSNGNDEDEVLTGSKDIPSNLGSISSI